jgi:membrane protease YdiL (CAAX protease family)
MRRSIFEFLSKKLIIIAAILISSFLTLLTGGLGYFFGIGVALIYLWSSHWKWSLFGIEKCGLLKMVALALLYAAGIFVIIDILVTPWVEIAFGTVDLDTFDFLRGNPVNYMIFILYMWVIAGFGEEFLYRGFFMKRLAVVFGDNNKGWILSAIIISTIFGLAHMYQGASGVISTALAGLLLSLIFFRHRKALPIAMLAHGFYDMIGLTLIYFSKETVITDFIRNLLN